jgi:hypothetical protein
MPKCTPEITGRVNGLEAGMVKRVRTSDVKYAPRAKVGRPLASEGDVRSDRLAQRVHPDLIEVYDQRAREYGLTRSQLIERVLIDHANQIEGAQLDNIGRWLSGEAWGVHKYMRKNLIYPVSGLPLAIASRKEAEHKAMQDKASAEDVGPKSTNNSAAKRTKRK